MSQTVSDCFGSFAFQVGDAVTGSNGAYLGLVVERLISEFGGAVYAVRNREKKHYIGEPELRASRVSKTEGGTNVN